MVNTVYSQDRALRILIVDGRKMNRLGMKAMLESRREDFFCQIALAADSTQAIDRACKSAFDVALIDETIGLMKEAGLMEKIQLQQPDLRILAIGDRVVMENVRGMLRAGATGYILRDIDSVDLVRAVQRTIDGKTYYAAEVANKLLENGKSNTHTRPFRISQRELEVLKLLNSDKTNREIAGELSIAVSTVETHRKSLMRKLEVRKVGGAIKKGYEWDLLP
jgi:DNA-binding NarL/FixJ family response regulator